MDNLKLNVHHNYDHDCDGHSYLKGISVIQVSIIIIIIVIGFIFTVIGNIRICNIVHWYKKHKKT